MNDVKQTTVNALRVLAVEGIEKANSGHPGLPLDAAPVAYALFQNHMIFNPKNPKFFNRDRFVLSAGHGSMLNYATLHLYGGEEQLFGRYDQRLDRDAYDRNAGVQQGAMQRGDPLAGFLYGRQRRASGRDEFDHACA